jgi:hypothetical protein
LSRAAAQNEADCVQKFREYWTDLRRFNKTFDENELPGPFDEFTMNLVNSKMGRSFVDAPADERATA